MRCRRLLRRHIGQYLRLHSCLPPKTVVLCATLAPAGDASPSAPGDPHEAHAGGDAGPAGAQGSGSSERGGALGGAPSASSAVGEDPAHSVRANGTDSRAQPPASSTSGQPISMWDSSGSAGDAGAGSPAASLRRGGGYFARGGADPEPGSCGDAAAVGNSSSGSAAEPPTTDSTGSGAWQQEREGVARMGGRPASGGDSAGVSGQERGDQGGGPLEGSLVGSVEVSLAASTRTRTLLLNAPDVRSLT